MSEQAMEIAESWVNYPTPPPDTLAHREFTLACAYLSQARQLAEAERENGRLREAIERVLVGVGIASWLDMEMVLRAALNPPDPPASPAEGGDTKGPGIT